MNALESQECILKVNFNDELLWEVIPEIYKKMPGWLGYGKDGKGEDAIPYWFSYEENKKMVNASVEPPGILFGGNMCEEEWNEWTSKLQQYSTELLGYKVEVFVY